MPKIVLAFLTCLLFTNTADAQPRNVQLWLARYCVSEAGFQVNKPFEEYTNDCAAIARVLSNRSSRGKVTIGIMRAYSRRLFDLDRNDRRCYISHLTTSHREPPCWPDNLAWSRYRGRFVEIYRLAGKLLTNEVTAPCDPDHWGAPTRRIRRRARGYGWRVVDCGNTLNEFWEIP